MILLHLVSLSIVSTNGSANSNLFIDDVSLISGRTISGNAGIAGASLNWSINGALNSRVADNNGNYTLGVPLGWTGTVTPSKSCYTFSPPYIPYSNVVTDQIAQDYIATFQPTFILSGNVGMAGATLWYVDNGPKTATADGSGIYSITVPCGWSGTVTPYMTGYTFKPINRAYNSMQSNQTGQDYTAQACAGCGDVNVTIGGNPMGSYTLASGQEVVPG